MSTEPDTDYAYYETVFFDIAEFLNEYEKLPCLWDRQHENFKDRKIRQLAEESLGEKLGIYDLTMLRKKIRSVRGTYNTEIRKIKSSLDSGTGLYIPRLSWFPLADKFLRVTTDVPSDVELSLDEGDLEYVPKKKILKKLPRQNGVTVVMVRGPMQKEEETSFVDTYEQEDEIEEIDENAYEEEVLELDDHDTEDDNSQNLKQNNTENESNIDTHEENQKDHIVNDNQSENKTNVRKRRLVMQRKFSSYDRDPSLVDVVKSLKDICRASENEFAAFGRSVGVQLQNMPIELALQIQTDIQAHITLARLDYLRKRKSRNEE